MSAVKDDVQTGMRAVVRAPIHAPKQERSRRSQERVLLAAQELLARNGHAAFQIGDVARLAKVGIGTIYARFGDRRGLLRSVQQAGVIEMQRQTITGLERLAGSTASPRQVVERAVLLLVRICRRHGDSLRQYFELATTDPVLREQGSAAARPAAEAFAALVAKAVRRRDGNPVVVGDMVWRLVFDACVYRVTYGAQSESPRHLPWTTFESELCRMAVAYAGCE